jgi:hypothetical protein
VKKRILVVLDSGDDCEIIQTVIKTDTGCGLRVDAIVDFSKKDNRKLLSHCARYVLKPQGIGLTRASMLLESIERSKLGPDEIQAPQPVLDGLTLHFDDYWRSVRFYNPRRTLANLPCCFLRCVGRLVGVAYWTGRRWKVEKV